MGRKDILHSHITLGFSARAAHRDFKDGQGVQFYQNSFRKVNVL